MLLNDLLESVDLDPESVLVFRHRPCEPELNKVLPWLAAERPTVFNAYQQTQGPKVEQAMARATHVAAFIGHEPGKALFVGLYEKGEARPLTKKQFWSIEANRELKTYGMNGFSDDETRSSVLWFDLELMDSYSNWKGKLIVQWPGLERSWWRWADRNEIAILAILEESQLASNMPNWEKIDFTWNDLAILPSPWKAALSQWRGVYYIFDTSDGRGYVGSAYGEFNIWGRWIDYAERGHGGNRLLRGRDPTSFRFSILQRVSPDMEAADIIHLESSWKDRLHTRQPYGLNDN